MAANQPKQIRARLSCKEGLTGRGVKITNRAYARRNKRIRGVGAG